jgi:hypothetical protein
MKVHMLVDGVPLCGNKSVAAACTSVENLCVRCEDCVYKLIGHLEDLVKAADEVAPDGRLSVRGLIDEAAKARAFLEKKGLV